jgi:hypothetical protein
MEKKLNAVEYAIKVTSFRKLVRDICRKNGMDYPSDEKVAEWIEQGYGMENVDDFIKDYTEKEGIFREPIADFIKELREHGIKESDDFIKDWVSKNGYNIDKFVNESIVNSYEPIERLALLATLELADEDLVALWNYFIEESAKYGEDSYIYDLDDADDVNLLRGGLKPSEWAKVVGFKCRYVSWHNLNDGRLLKYDDEGIKDVIVGYWSDIFPRLMVWSELYDIIGEDKDKIAYFDFIVRPIICKHLGYEYDPERGTFEEIKK